VLLARVEPALLDSGPEPTSEPDRERRDLDRRELYVAMTHARDGLWVGVRSLTVQPAELHGTASGLRLLTPRRHQHPGKGRGRVWRRGLERLRTPHQEAHVITTNHELVGRAVKKLARGFEPIIAETHRPRLVTGMP
jgi:hypothetical protein